MEHPLYTGTEAVCLKLIFTIFSCSVKKVPLLKKH